MFGPEALPPRARLMLRDSAERELLAWPARQIRLRIWQGRVADVVGAILRLAGRLERAADCLFRILRGTYERGVAP